MPFYLFCGLGFLIMRKRKIGVIDFNRFWGAFILSFLWAVIDEVHQLFVPTRDGKIRDILIDTMGILFALYLVKRILPRASKKLRMLASKLGI